MVHRLVLLVALFLPITACNSAAVSDEPTKTASLQVVALDDSAITVTAEDLKKFPRTSLEVKDRSGQVIKYSGVAVHHLLTQVKAPLGEELRDEALRCFVAVKAKDEYRVVFALCEFDPEFTDRLILLADEKNGQPLDEATGPFQIIVPGEKRRARWVRQVDRIRIMESRVVDEDAPTEPKQPE
ncbi:MAG: molybdopterin-dependent oxidoreductase [Planctomyces sp.]|nr:molybdopterin-dependent oxidoreductase [Planctomyces sp.]